MQTEAAAYLVGRPKRPFPEEGESLEDALLAADRLDGRELGHRTCRHCTFSNVSFKNVRLDQCTFEDCVFIGCYFRKTVLQSCKFVGCRFLGCDFPHIEIRSSDFRYSQFHNCTLPYAEMEHSLPSEPNLRHELASVLAHSADRVGETQEARRYRLAAIEARNEHLWAGVKHKSAWYQEHFPDWSTRSGAFLRVVASHANGQLWGHGEKWSILARNILLLMVLFLPGALWTVRDGLTTVPASPLGLTDIIWLSVSTVVPVDGIAIVQATSVEARFVLTVGAFIGLVLAGLLVTMVFRAVVRR